MSRLPGRIRIFARALPRLIGKPWRRRPASVQRILIAHHLLLGDTLLLTPLVAKLRAQIRKRISRLPVRRPLCRCTKDSLSG